MTGDANPEKPVAQPPVLGPAPGLDFILVSDDELLVQFGTGSKPSELFRDNDLTGVIGAVVRQLLARPTSREALVSPLPEACRADGESFISSLVEEGIIGDVALDPVDQYLRYSFTGEQHLSEMSVAMIGCGPIAARIANSLLQSGIGRLMLSDGRLTDEYWHRSVVPGDPVQTDQATHDVLAQTLQRCGHSQVVGQPWNNGAAVELMVGQADFLILALERPNLQLAHSINRCCVEAGRHWLHVVLDGNAGLIGPHFMPPDSACYNDFQALARAATPDRAMARRYREHLLERPSSSFFTGLPAYSDTVAGHGAVAALQCLARGTSHLLGRVMIIDFDRMRIDVEDVLKLPRCPVCRHRHPPARPPFPEYPEALEQC